MAGEDTDRLPRDLGPLRLVRRLGAGGMGTVYEAVLAQACGGLPPGSRVAAKVFRDEGMEGDRAIERLRREALVGSSLRHPAIVRTHDLIEARDGDRSRHVLLMELVDGTTLRQIVDSMGALPEPLLRHVALQLAAALDAIHSAGIVHRDVKPENVLVSDGHQVKLSDLGIARKLAVTTDLTATGSFLGSVAYASPEHFGSGTLSPRSDLYSLGVVLHEAACGRRPFEDATIAGLIRRHVEQRPRRLGELATEISPFLEELVVSLLEKDPERRVPSAARLAEILAEGERSDWWRRREGSEAPRPRPGRAAPFVGRDADMERADEAVRAALGGEGGLLLIEGEAGVGKSRLLDELCARIEAREPKALLLRGENPPGGSGRGAVAESLAAPFGETALRRLLDAHLASPEAAAALASWALGLPAPPGVMLTRDLVHAALGRLAASLADERPLAWLVEDLHFAHAEERALVAALSRAARGHRMLVVATMRPGLPQDDLSALDRLGARRLSLSRLSARAVVDLLETSLGSRRLAEDLGGRVAAKTDGNPYFVIALVRDLQEKGAVRRGQDGTWSAVGRISAIEVPTSVKSLMLERASALSSEERAVVDAAAVQGFHFEGELVAEVLGLTRLAALQLLAAVERRTALVRAAGARYQFDHHQMQETLLEAIPAPLRSEYHALVAKALSAREKPGEPDGELAARVAQHALRGGLAELAESRLGPAFLHFRTRLQNEAAIDLALLARERFAPGTAARSLAGSRLAYTYELVGRTPEALAMAEEAIRDADEGASPAVAAQARHALVAVLSRAGRLERATAVALEGREMARSCGATSVEAKHVATLGTIHAMSGRIGEAVAFFREAAASFAAAGSPGDEAIALGNLAQALAGTGSPEALASARRSLLLARQGGDALQAVFAESTVGMLLAEAGDLEAAIEALDRAVTRSREIGVARLVPMTLERHASALLSAGRLDAALECCREGIADGDARGDRRVEARLLAHRVQADAAASHDATARALLDRALEAARAVENPVELRLIALSRAAWARRSRHDDMARAEVDAATDVRLERADALLGAWRARLFAEAEPPPEDVRRLPFDARCEALALLGRHAELAELEASVAAKLEVEHRAAFARHGAPARALTLGRA